MKKLSLILALLSVVLLGFSQSSGDMRYSGGDIQYYNGSTWVTISSTSSVNPETFGAATVKGSAEGKYVYTATGGTESKILVDSIGSWFGHQVISISNDTIYLTDGGFAVLPSTPAELWETHENGIATIDSEEVYLLNILNGCAIDTSIISDSAGYEGMDIVLGTGYASDNDLSSNGVLTNNTPTALASLDGTRFRVQSDSAGVFSLPISIADSACYQGKVLTGVRFEINGVTTSALKSDSSNTVRVIPTLEDNDSIAYIDTLVENISIIINGTDTNVVTTINFTAVNANDGFSGLNFSNQYDFRLTFPCSDTVDFYIDQIKAVPIYDGTLGNINIGLNPVTGEVIEYPINLKDIPEYTHTEVVERSGEYVVGEYMIINDFKTYIKRQYSGDSASLGVVNEIVDSFEVEPIIVQARTKNTLSPIAWSTVYPDDILVYSLTNPLDWSDYREIDGLKGVIYKRTDIIRNISLALNWRYIKFPRWNNGSDVYNVYRKNLASDTTDFELFYPLSPFSLKTTIIGRGSPDNYYAVSNVVLKAGGEIKATLTTTSGSNIATYTYDTTLAHYDYVLEWADSGATVTASSLPGGTTLTSITSGTITLNQNATATGTNIVTIYETESLVTAVNDILSATNLTIEDRFYDNQVDIMIGGTANDFFFNKGLSFSGYSFNTISNNTFGKINSTTGVGFDFSNNSAKNLTSVTFNGDVLNTNFLTDVESETITPSAAMQAGTGSIYAAGEITGLGDALEFNDYSNVNFEVDNLSFITGNEAADKIWTSDASGNGDWRDLAIEFTPSSSTDATYSKGTITYDASYLYIKTDDSVSGTDTWLRVSIATW